MTPKLGGAGVTPASPQASIPTVRSRRRGGRSAVEGARSKAPPSPPPSHTLGHPKGQPVTSPPASPPQPGPQPGASPARKSPMPGPAAAASSRPAPPGTREPAGAPSPRLQLRAPSERRTSPGAGGGCAGTPGRWMPGSSRELLGNLPALPRAQSRHIKGRRGQREAGQEPLVPASAQLRRPTVLPLPRAGVPGGHTWAWGRAPPAAWHPAHRCGNRHQLWVYFLHRGCRGNLAGCHLIPPGLSGPPL